MTAAAHPTYRPLLGDTPGGSRRAMAARPRARHEETTR